MIVTVSMECQSAAAEPTSSPHDTHDIAASTSVPRVYPPLPNIKYDKMDVSMWYNSLEGLSDMERYELLIGSWTPPQNYKFPSHRECIGCGKKQRTTMRSFQMDWLRKWPWLRYSAKLDGGFCLPCVLFAKERGELGQLVLRPLTFFTPATTVMADHNMKTYHRDAIKDMDRFRHNFEHPEQQQDCDVQVITQERQKVAENRQKLTSIIKTILWLGRQNVALRGYREANPADLAGDASPLESNSGNFYALLKFGVECGDETLRSHLLFGKRNALYCSPQIQNDILRSAGSWIRQQLDADVKASGMCSILADEVADVSNQEQLSLVVRFVDAADCSIREEFGGFVPCLDGISDEALAAAILKELADLNIPGAMIRGQGYDGASNMSGKNRVWRK